MQALILFLLIGFISPANIDSNVEISDKKVRVVFNANIDFSDLVKIKLDLANKGITLNYKKIVFTEFNELEEIAFEVDCNDGFKGSASKSNISYNGKFGFARNYIGEEAFATGDIGDK